MYRQNIFTVLLYIEISGNLLIFEYGYLLFFYLFLSVRLYACPWLFLEIRNYIQMNFDDIIEIYFNLGNSPSFNNIGSIVLEIWVVAKFNVTFYIVTELKILIKLQKILIIIDENIIIFIYSIVNQTRNLSPLKLHTCALAKLGYHLHHYILVKIKI